ncbi:single-strand binding protein [gamma proteobacterium BDW918]|nr:single-strand binding protein [gamma proteobacterium BDW918]
MFQSTTIIGRIGQITPAATADGKAISNFTVVTTKSVKQDDGSFKDYDNWHRLVAFGPIAEAINSRNALGDLILLDKLELRTRDYEKDGETRYITELYLTEFPKKLPKYYTKGDSQGSQQAAPPQQRQQSRPSGRSSSNQGRTSANNGYGSNVPV